MERQGNIRIASENMMPIIKKWLYSDKDIFLREIVSNASDAITKYKKLVSLGEASEDERYQIVVTTDDKAGTLTVEDNGIGMTEEEVEKYITQIAFSGAADFLEKYEKAGGEGIIGHFGLGFYSAYMVSDNIEIFTKSYREGSKGVHWQSDGNSTYTIGECDKQTRGTKVVMHLAEGEKEFARESEVRKLLNKYCSFMPYEIFLNPKPEEELNKDLKEGEEPKKNTPVNTTEPLYLKQPKDCTEEEYKDFYRHTFADFNEPLFWIHLNMEYPFRLKGILYFPKVRKQVELERGQVKLYCNQVFIADNIKEVIPEFLMLLNGVIDCPDIPLNVSRSPSFRTMRRCRRSQSISPRRLRISSRNSTATTRKSTRTAGTILRPSSSSAASRTTDSTIRSRISSSTKTSKANTFRFLPCSAKRSRKRTPRMARSRSPSTTSPTKRSRRSISKCSKTRADAIVCDTYIDPHFISYIEYKNPTRVRILRIDADIAGALKEAGEENADESKEIQGIFEKALEGKHVKVTAEKLKDADVPAVVNVSEFMRRMSEMTPSI